MSSSDREKVIRAIYDLGKVVTAADVTTATGLPLQRSQRLLNEITLSHSGWLQVHQGGGIAYCFADLDKGALNRSMEAALNTALEQLGRMWSHALSLFVGFGLFLCFGFVFGVCLTTVSLIAYLIWRATTYLSTLRHQQPPKSLGETLHGLWKRTEKLFISCHRFVVGPGDPNADIVERRWLLLADLIRSQNGVLVYEQLAPLSLGRFDFRREDAILPLLLRFNGVPQVSPQGNIIYTFPELTSAAAEQDHENERCLVEQEWQYFGLIGNESVLVPSLILLNIGALSVVTSIIHMQFVFAPIWHTLYFFALALVCIPIIRCSIVSWRNVAIRFRNARRQRYLRLLQSPERALSAKLDEAKAFAHDTALVTSEPVVYNTTKDLLEQQFDE